MSPISSDARWVENRAECSIDAAFERLCVRVSADVDAANKVLKSLRRQSKGNVACERAETRKLIVSVVWDLSGFIEGEGVSLELKDGQIVVTRLGQGRAPAFMFVARPTLAADGECRLRIDDAGEPLEFWQVSRQALEELLFG